MTTAPAVARGTWADVIPQHMQDRPQWVAWGPDPDNGRPKCPLIIAAGGRRASSTDPATWRSYVVALVHRARTDGARTGVGYVFTASDGLVFVDFDKCLDASGALKPWARPLVEPFIGRTYVETSPSGTGLHVFARATGPETGKVAKVGDGQIEVYTRGRYSTITGAVFAGSDLLDEAQGPVDALLAAVMPHPPAVVRREHRPPTDRDADVAVRALRGLSPDLPYPEWIAVGMALHARWPDGEGLALWDAWSSSGETYPGTRQLERHWRSFNANGGVGLGTLVALARRAG